MVVVVNLFDLHKTKPNPQQMRYRRGPLFSSRDSSDWTCAALTHHQSPCIAVGLYLFAHSHRPVDFMEQELWLPLFRVPGA